MTINRQEALSNERPISNFETRMRKYILVYVRGVSCAYNSPLLTSFKVIQRFVGFIIFCFASLNQYPQIEVASCYIFLHLILSSDVHPNPGPPIPNLSCSYLSFRNLNLNTLIKDNFHRISLLEEFWDHW